VSIGAGVVAGGVTAGGAAAGGAALLSLGFCASSPPLEKATSIGTSTATRNIIAFKCLLLLTRCLVPG
jgi:hypothetical protein